MPLLCFFGVSGEEVAAAGTSFLEGAPTSRMLLLCIFFFVGLLLNGGAEARLKLLWCSPFGFEVEIRASPSEFCTWTADLFALSGWSRALAAVKASFSVCNARIRAANSSSLIYAACLVGMIETRKGQLWCRNNQS